MDEHISNFKANLPPHLQIKVVNDSFLLLSNEEHPSLILNIPLIHPLPEVSEIEKRFDELIIHSGIMQPHEELHNFDIFPFPKGNTFTPLNPQDDLYFNPNSSFFNRDYSINHKPTRSEIDRLRFPQGARIFPMSPLKPLNKGKDDRKQFYTFDPDLNPDPEYPFAGEDDI